MVNQIATVVGVLCKNMLFKMGVLSCTAEPHSFLHNKMVVYLVLFGEAVRPSTRFHRVEFDLKLFGYTHCSKPRKGTPA